MDSLEYSRELIGKSAHSRSQLVQSELALCATLCDLAATDMRFGKRAEAQMILSKIVEEIHAIRTRLAEPQHRLPEPSEPIFEQLSKLEMRICELQQVLRPRVQA